jgi:hypothetical protein
MRRFDWRWLALIAFVAILLNGARLPWPVSAITLIVAGGYMIVLGWQSWVRWGGPPSRGNVSYWRGQRYETAPVRRGPATPRWDEISRALPYFMIGGALVLTGIVIILRQLGY